MRTRSPIVKDVSRIVEQACAAESNIFGYSIWTHHILYVVANGRKLAWKLGADLELVELAALLHDYASIKDADLYPDHHIHSPREAEALLRRYAYPQERIEIVKEAIAAHRGSVRVDADSPEALCLRNADAMAHFQNIPSLLELAYTRKSLTADEGAQWVLAKLGRSWQKMTPGAQESVLALYQAAHAILKKAAPATVV